MDNIDLNPSELQSSYIDCVRKQYSYDIPEVTGSPDSQDNTLLKEFVKRINISELEQQKLNYFEEQDLIQAYDKIRKHIEKKLEPKYHGNLMRIGSFKDGTKVGEVNEFDTIYSIKHNYQVKTKRESKSYLLFKDGDPVDAAATREQFGRAVDRIAESMPLPEHLEHSGYGSPRFSGVRFNGPAVTLLFTWKKKRQLSLDITIGFVVSGDLLAEISPVVQSRLNVIQEANQHRPLNFDDTVHLVPNISDDSWLLSTAQLEASVIELLSLNCAFKRAIILSKIICHDMADLNKVLFTELKSGKPDSSNVVTRVHRMVGRLPKYSVEEFKSYMKYGHNFLPPETALNHSEIPKSILSINTAAVKHLAFDLVASDYPLAFGEPHDMALVELLVGKIFRILSTSHKKSVQHFFLKCDISYASPSAYATLEMDISSLHQILKNNCLLVANSVSSLARGNILRTDETLQRYVVPPELLEHAEFTFQVPQKFDVVGPIQGDPMFAILMKVICALLNGPGGVVRLSESVDGIDKAMIKRWWQDVLSHVALHLPDGILPDVVLKLYLDGAPLCLVKASKYLITLNAHLYCRTGPGLSVAGVMNFNQQANIVNQGTGSANDSIIENAVLKKGDLIQLKSKANVIFLSTRKLKHVIQKPEIYKLIFCFGNQHGGGHIILGTTKSSTGQIIEGIVVKPTEQEHFRKLFFEFLCNDPISGRTRIWGQRGHLPVEGREWSIQYIPVAEHDGSDERVVVLLYISQHKGGVFLELPEAYSVTDEGLVSPLTFDQWIQWFRLRLETSQPKSQPQDDSEEIYTPLEVATDVTLSERVNVEDNIYAPLHVAEGVSPQVVDENQLNDALTSCRRLSWIDHTRNWKRHINHRPKGNVENLRQFTKHCTTLSANNPIRFTPNESVIIRATLPETADAISKIKTYHKNKKGFGLGSKCLASILATCSIPEHPPHHVVDFLTVDDQPCIHLWVVVEGIGDESDQIKQWAYIHITGRLLKKHMIGSLDDRTSGHNIADLTICCHLLPLSGSNIIRDMHDQVTTFFDVENEFEHVRYALANALFQKQTAFYDRIGNAISVTLTAQQLSIVLDRDFFKFNLVDGPPGSGKTYIALYLARHLCGKTDPSKVGYVCSNPGLKALVDSQRVAKTILVEDSKDIWTQTKSNLTGLVFLILDDVQTLACSESHWRKLFDYTYEKGIRLFALMDSKIQNFKDDGHTKAFAELLGKFCESKNEHLNHSVLNEVHRNKKKIVSYMKIAADLEDPIPCSAVDDGDDVEVLPMVDIRQDTQDNPLLLYIRTLTDPNKVFAGMAGCYALNEIVLLVDGENASKDVDIFRNILGKINDSNIQSADRFPVEGLIIDTVDNFHGLEAPVCIFVVPSKYFNVSEKTKNFKRSLKNRFRRSFQELSKLQPQYKAFIASRAVDRVVFIVDSNLNHQLTEQLNFSNRRLLHNDLTTSNCEGEYLTTHTIVSDAMCVKPYSGTTENTFSVCEGETLQVISETTDTFVVQNNNGQRGEVPCSHLIERRNIQFHLSCDQCDWFHGDVTRRESENLFDPRRDGLYLVRKSEYYRGDYTLCVCMSNTVHHYRIQHVDGSFHINDKNTFHSIPLLIQHYQTAADDLCTTLKKPVKNYNALLYWCDILKSHGWLLSDRDLIVTEDSVNSGEINEIHHGKYLPNGEQPVYIKQQKDGGQNATRLLGEAVVLSTLRHQNIVRMIGVSCNPLRLVLESLDRKNLLGHLVDRRKSKQSFSDRQALKIASQICQAMAYVEMTGIVHRDLQERNIFLTPQFHVKVSGFARAMHCDSGVCYDANLPWKWTAPEILRKDTFTSKADVWSFGVLLWRIYSLADWPYRGVRPEDIYAKLQGGYRLPRPDYCPDQMFSLIRSMWHFEKNDRPTFEQLISSMQRLEE